MVSANEAKRIDLQENKDLNEKLIKIATFNTELNALLGTDFQAFSIYRSKGLLTHLINRKHYTAAKYIDYLPEIISSLKNNSLKKLSLINCFKSTEDFSLFNDYFFTPNNIEEINLSKHDFNIPTLLSTSLLNYSKSKNDGYFK